MEDSREMSVGWQDVPHDGVVDDIIGAILAHSTKDYLSVLDIMGDCMNFLQMYDTGVLAVYVEYVLHFMVDNALGMVGKLDEIGVAPVDRPVGEVIAEIGDIVRYAKRDENWDWWFDCTEKGAEWGTRYAVEVDPGLKRYKVLDEKFDRKLESGEIVYREYGA